MRLEDADRLHRIAEAEGIVGLLEELSPELEDAHIVVWVPAGVVRGKG